MTRIFRVILTYNTERRDLDESTVEQIVCDSLASEISSVGTISVVEEGPE